jgi:hypothetical protein
MCGEPCDNVVVSVVKIDRSSMNHVLPKDSGAHDVSMLGKLLALVAW